MKILRHEAGHAIDNAYRLQRRRKRQKLFGPNSVPYPEYYSPKPYSKSFVLHLDSWYAQSHPAEDFAETFAVWLTPDSQWRTRYSDWPAIKKLEYMDELMRRDRRQAAALSRRTSRWSPSPSSGARCGQHYKQKRAHYGVNRPDFYDRDLRRLFTDDPGRRRRHDGGALRREGPHATSAAASLAGRASTSTRSTRCSRTSPCAARSSSSACGRPRSRPGSTSSRC